MRRKIDPVGGMEVEEISGTEHCLHYAKTYFFCVFSCKNRQTAIVFFGNFGIALFYGFRDDGQANADSTLSGKPAWEYACKRRKGKSWQCEYVDFNKPEDIRIYSRRHKE